MKVYLNKNPKFPNKIFVDLLCFSHYFGTRQGINIFKFPTPTPPPHSYSYTADIMYHIHVSRRNGPKLCKC